MRYVIFKRELYNLLGVFFGFIIVRERDYVGKYRNYFGLGKFYVL